MFLQVAEIYLTNWTLERKIPPHLFQPLLCSLHFNNRSPKTVLGLGLYAVGVEGFILSFKGLL